MKRKLRKKLTVLRLPRPSLALALLLILGLLLAGELAADRMRPALAPSLFGAAIVIDPGHGGADPGMVGAELPEKDVNLAVAQALAEYCRAAGAAVTLTREEDRALAEGKRDDLAARAKLAAEADVFISLHCNSFVADPQQHGAQVFYAPGSEEGRILAEVLQQALAEQLANTDRSPLPHPDSYLLKQANGAAVIVEMGFLSNPAEGELLAQPDYQWELAWALFRGLCAWRQGG